MGATGSNSCTLGGWGQGWRKHFQKAGRLCPAPVGCAVAGLSRSASEPSDLLKEQVCLLIYWVSILVHSEPSMAGQNQHPLGAW